MPATLFAPNRQFDRSHAEFSTMLFVPSLSISMPRHYADEGLQPGLVKAEVGFDPLGIGDEVLGRRLQLRQHRAGNDAVLSGRPVGNALDQNLVRAHHRSSDGPEGSLIRIVGRALRQTA